MMKRRDNYRGHDGPVYKITGFVNKLTNESVENWFAGEVSEIEGKQFWKTYTAGAHKQPVRVNLLSKDSWTLRRRG